MDTPVLAEQQKLTFISSVYGYWQEQWPIVTDGERMSKESVQSATFDDDDDNLIYLQSNSYSVLNGFCTFV